MTRCGILIKYNQPKNGLFSRPGIEEPSVGGGMRGSMIHVNESAENYLETILILSKSRPVVRSVDVAEELGFKKSSVSVAMKNLREKKHITVTKEGYIYLTESGRRIAEMIYERHEMLSAWLVFLGVDEKVAAQDACRIEHVISAESFEAIKAHIRRAEEKTAQDSGDAAGRNGQEKG